MTPQLIFYFILGIISFNFVLETFLDYLNFSRFDAQIPSEISQVYDDEEYQKSQKYKKDKFKLRVFQSAFSFVLIVLFLSFDGFEKLDTLAKQIFDDSIGISLVFFGILFLVSEVLSLPFTYYSTFVIEEKYGFNTSTKALFWIDQLKSMLLTVIVGGIVLGLIILFYQVVGSDFWWYTWIFITVISIFTNMFYAKLIVPIFNKQTPLEEGALRNKIEDYATRLNFELKNIFVIDGSKRSKKANAYFSGFGKEKRITLYDTLLEDLEDDEIVAVLAHEVGHYKKNHILINLLVSTLFLGITLWLLSLFVSEPILAQALGVDEVSFHIGLVAFSFLYAPISLITGLVTNFLSRKFEYQADNFAKTTFSSAYLVDALKKLSRKSLSNLTPHPAYVFFHYSHPPLAKRIKNLENNL